MSRKKTGRQLIHHLKYNNDLFLIKDLRSLIRQLPHLKKFAKMPC